MRSIAILTVLAICCTADGADRRGKSRGQGAWAYAVAKSAPATTPAPVGRAGAESKCAIDEVNEARKAKGMPPLIHDPLLSLGAYEAAKQRASRGLAGHLESDFACLPAGAKADSAGCAALEPSWGWQSCCWDDPQYTHAGAAWVMGSDGRRYNHIFVRTEGKAVAASTAPVTYQQSANTCANGTCGTVSERRGLFRRR